MYLCALVVYTRLSRANYKLTVVEDKTVTSEYIIQISTQSRLGEIYCCKTEEIRVIRACYHTIIATIAITCQSMKILHLPV